MIYIVTIFMLTMQVGSEFYNKTYKVKKKMCGACVSFRKNFMHFCQVLFLVVRMGSQLLFNCSFQVFTYFVCFLIVICFLTVFIL